MVSVNLADSCVPSDQSQFTNRAKRKWGGVFSSKCRCNVVCHESSFSRCILGCGRIGARGPFPWNFGAVTKRPNARIPMHRATFIDHDCAMRATFAVECLYERIGGDAACPNKRPSTEPFSPF